MIPNSSNHITIHASEFYQPIPLIAFCPLQGFYKSQKFLEIPSSTHKQASTVLNGSGITLSFTRSDPLKFTPFLSRMNLLPLTVILGCLRTLFSSSLTDHHMKSIKHNERIWKDFLHKCREALPTCPHSHAFTCWRTLRKS